MPTKPVRFITSHPVLVIAFLVAFATMCLVPPDERYANYFDWKTLSCLFCILALVEALRNRRVFEKIARALIERLANCRATGTAIVAITLCISLFATNDMALVMMLPLAIATFVRAGWQSKIPILLTMQTLAANLGGMLLPFGNPQNLYLYEHFNISLFDFLAEMLLPFATSVILIAICCLLFLKPNPQTDMIPGNVTAPNRQGEGNKAKTVLSNRLVVVILVLLFILVIAAVFRLLPFYLSLGATVIALLFIDRSALRAVDVPLLLTFICFFVFAGNMARIEVFEVLIESWMSWNALATSALASQVISNVPSAILLSQFTDCWQPLLVGVNIGGAGTLVASLANLITLNQYRKYKTVQKVSAENACEDTLLSGFIPTFTLFNFAFLAILLLVCLA